MMEICLAIPADIGKMTELARQFVEESNYGWTFDAERARATFMQFMQHEEAAVMIAVDEDGTIAGGALLAIDSDFIAERVGYVAKFYIAPVYRGTPTARQLVQEMYIWFRAKGCVAAFATATANIGAASSKQYENLFAKFGFRDCGPTLMRDYVNE